MKNLCKYMSEFHMGFLLGGGNLFWNREIDIKQTLLGRTGGCTPRKVLTNHRPEIESGGFWQLADCSKCLLLVCKTTAILSFINYVIIVF